MSRTVLIIDKTLSKILNSYYFMFKYIKSWCTKKFENLFCLENSKRWENNKLQKRIAIIKLLLKSNLPNTNQNVNAKIMYELTE